MQAIYTKYLSPTNTKGARIKSLTQTLKTALALVDCRVLDHMIVGGGNVMSFAERGMI